MLTSGVCGEVPNPYPLAPTTACAYAQCYACLLPRLSMDDVAVHAALDTGTAYSVPRTTVSRARHPRLAWITPPERPVSPLRDPSDLPNPVACQLDPRPAKALLVLFLLVSILGQVTIRVGNAVAPLSDQPSFFAGFPRDDAVSAVCAERPVYIGNSDSQKIGTTS